MKNTTNQGHFRDPPGGSRNCPLQKMRPPETCNEQCTLIIPQKAPIWGENTQCAKMCSYENNTQKKSSSFSKLEILLFFA